MIQPMPKLRDPQFCKCIGGESMVLSTQSEPVKERINSCQACSMSQFTHETVREGAESGQSVSEEGRLI